MPSCPQRLLKSLASHAERTVTPCVAEADGGGGTSGCAAADGVAPENPGSAEGRPTKPEGNGELPAGQAGGGIGTALVPLGGEEVPKYLLYLSTCRRHRRDDTVKGCTLLLQK